MKHGAVKVIANIYVYVHLWQMKVVGIPTKNVSLLVPTDGSTPICLIIYMFTIYIFTNINIYIYIIGGYTFIHINIHIYNYIYISSHYGENMRHLE